MLAASYTQSVDSMWATVALPSRFFSNLELLSGPIVDGNVRRLGSTGESRLVYHPSVFIFYLLAKPMNVFSVRPRNAVILYKHRIIEKYLKAARAHAQQQQGREATVAGI